MFLASKWRATSVQEALDADDRESLITFLRERYQERFFDPIRFLRQAPDSHQGYGMAMMSLCSLLIESIQCLRDGLPSTNKEELNRLARYSPPTLYDVPRADWKKGADAFRDFFSHFRSFFPDVEGEEFYRSIRNGLLHQAQTKNGWRIRVDWAKLCDPDNKVINRNLFAEALERAFESYLQELHNNATDSEIWKKARRKVWWLIRLSQ